MREIVEASARLGIQALTLYVFSVENWKRPRAEVATLMMLLKRYLRLELGTLIDNNLRFLVIGRPEDLEPELHAELDAAVQRTAGNTGMRLNVALNYGGRAEIVDAARRAIREGIAADALDEERFSRLLYTAGQPDPDLLIRTSGELRVSNFLLWQIAYAEIYVTETFWPDFRTRHLLEAILAYQKRERRYGGIRPQAWPSDSDAAPERRSAPGADRRRGAGGRRRHCCSSGAAGGGAGDRGVLHVGRAPRRPGPGCARIRGGRGRSARLSRGRPLASRQSSWRS